MPRFMQRFKFQLEAQNRSCEYCGIPFMPKRKDQIYHTKACKVAAHRQRIERDREFRQWAEMMGYTVTKKEKKDGE